MGRSPGLVSGAVIALLLAITLPTVSTPPAAAAVPPAFSTFTHPDVRSPTSMVLGPDGALWFLSQANDRVGRIDPTSGEITTYPSGGLLPWDLVLGPDGNLWIADEVRILIRFDPDTGATTLFDTPQIDRARAIGVGHDGDLWLSSVGDAEGPGPRISRFDLATSTYTHYLPGRISLGKPVAGGDGNMWISSGEGVVIRVNPNDGVITQFVTPNHLRPPERLHWGSDDGLWYPGGTGFVRLDPSQGTFGQRPVPGGRGGIPIENPDGRFWFGTDEPDALSSFDLDTAEVSTFTDPTGLIDGPRDLVFGPDGNLWFASFRNHRIGRLGLTGGPSMAVTKIRDEAAVVAGSPIHYHVTVRNTGDTPLTGISVTDANAPGCGGPVADLAVGEQVTVDCVYTTTFADRGTRTNVASADSNETPVAVSQQVSTTVTANPQLSVTKAVDETVVDAGESIHYHVTVTNTGDQPLTGVTVTDDNAPDCAGPVADLVLGAHITVECSYTTTATDGASGTYSNRARADSNETGAVASNIVSTTVRPLLTVVKTADETSVVAGEDINYHLTLTNVSDAPLTGVSITDPYAPDCDGTVANLPVDAVAAVDCTYTTTFADVGTYANVATVNTDQLSGAMSNEVSTAVTANPSVSVTTDALQDAVVAGEDIDIRVTVENTGDVTLTEVVVSDPNAPGCAGPVDDIAAGDDVTVECTVTTPPGMEGHYFNAATVDTHETDPVTSSTHYVVVTPLRRPDLTLRLDGRPWVGDDVIGTDEVDQTVSATRRPGGRAVFFVRITNDGDADEVFDLRRIGAATAGVRVRYFAGRSAADLTRSIVDRSYRTPSLDPGESITIRVEATLAAGARAGRTHDVLLRTRSVADPATADTVTASVHVR